jgi:hypothetical protein
MGQEVLQSIREEMELTEGPDWDDFYERLDKDGSPTAYVFRCRRCGVLGGYSDCE